MKRIIALLVVQCFCTVIFAQFGSKGVYSTNRQAVVLDNDSTRTIYGGTIIIPTYVGSGFNSTIRNAFDYACKIWEEQIPTTFPLNIEVRLGALTGDSTLAMVEPQFNLEDDLCSYVYPHEIDYRENAIIKRHAQLDDDWQVGANYYIGSTDAIITFNTNKTFSYKTNASVIDPNKYDFITVAIQAIGKALGFYFMAYYDGTNLNTFTNSNYFTKYVMNGQQAISYQNAVSSIQGAQLYHPLVFNNNYALSYFDIDAANDGTLFMQPGIASGTSIRYIGEDMQKVFRILDFEEQITTGEEPPQVLIYSSDSTEVGLDYNWDSDRNLSSGHRSGQTSSLTYTNYFQECKEHQPVGNYVLKANGAWQAYTTLSEIDPRDTIYARSYDGYLRTMNIRYDANSNPYVWPYVNYVITHRLYRCPPLRPVFDMNNFSVSDRGRMSNNPRRQMAYSANTMLEDDDFLDVEIGFENTEGCTSILVEQTDSDWPIPYTYFVNPSDGYFTAYMIRQYPSSFKLTYVNNKGQTQSQSKVIDLSSTRERTLMAETYDDNTTLHYTLSGGSNDESFSGTYSIVDLNTFRTVGQGEISGPTGDIDVSRLSNGLYSFSIRDSRNKLYSTKWNKQL